MVSTAEDFRELVDFFLPFFPLGVHFRKTVTTFSQVQVFWCCLIMSKVSCFFQQPKTSTTLCERSNCCRLCKVLNRGITTSNGTRTMISLLKANVVANICECRPILTTSKQSASETMSTASDSVDSETYVAKKTKATVTFPLLRLQQH